MIWQWFRRELTSSSLLIVCFSLMLAFATAFSLGDLNDRIVRGLGQQNQQLLAGDRVLRSNYPIDESWLTTAKQQHLEISQQLTFSTMAYFQDQIQLIEVKAVDASYPLYGKLITNPNVTLSHDQVLVAEKLLFQLHANIGDQIDIGDNTFTIAGVIIAEPDAKFTPFNISPKVIIMLDDAIKTGAIQPGSRLTYRYMFKGESSALIYLDNIIKPNLRTDQRWSDLNDSGNETLNQALDRAKLFLTLTSILVLALVITAIIVAMNHYCRSRYDLVAVLKTLGANRLKLTRLVVGQWLIMVVIAIIFGTLIGLVLESLLIHLLRNVLPESLPVREWKPWLSGVLLLIIISALIGIRPYLQLLSTPPIRVLRNDAVILRWPLRYYLPIVSLLLISLIVLLIGFNIIWWSLLIGIVILALALGIIGWGGLAILRLIVTKNLALRLAINRLLRSPLSTLSQLGTFSLSLMLLALLILVKSEVLASWQTSLPEDSPNYFIVNIPPSQYAEVEQFFATKNIQLGHNFPIIRARLTDINQQPVSELIEKTSPGYNTANRELNLTWYNDPTPYNQIVAGNWPPQQYEVSVSEQQAKDLNIKLGDQLTFMGNALPFTATVTSLRHVDWETLKPNFVFIFDQHTLAQQPQYGFTSFKYQSDPKLLVEFNRQYPMIMIMDISDIVNQIFSLINQITQTLQLIVILVLICGVLLLVSQLQVGMQQRYLEMKVYRILGAKLRLLNATLLIEFFILGTVSGLIAILGAEIALYSLQTYVFKFDWHPNVIYWILTPLISGGIFSLIGCLLSKKLLKRQLTKI